MSRCLCAALPPRLPLCVPLHLRLLLHASSSTKIVSPFPGGGILITFFFGIHVCSRVYEACPNACPWVYVTGCASSGEVCLGPVWVCVTGGRWGRETRRACGAGCLTRRCGVAGNKQERRAGWQSRKGGTSSHRPPLGGGASPHQRPRLLDCAGADCGCQNRLHGPRGPAHLHFCGTWPCSSADAFQFFLRFLPVHVARPNYVQALSGLSTPANHGGPSHTGGRNWLCPPPSVFECSAIAQACPCTLCRSRYYPGPPLWVLLGPP